MLHYATYPNFRNLFHSPKNLYKVKLDESSLVDCQRGILHFPIMFCAPGGVKGSLWRFVLHPVHLCGPVVSSEVHCCVDDAAVFLLGDNSCQCWRGSVEYKESICFKKKQKNKTSDNESQGQHVPTLALTRISLVSDSFSVSPYLAAKKNKIHLNRFHNAQSNF